MTEIIGTRTTTGTLVGSVNHPLVVHNGGGGVNGVTFTPSISEEGVLSWTNDGGRENPEPVNIIGPKGDNGEQGIQGEQGPAGKDGVDGKNGADGRDGVDGKDGADGYTPVKGVDYFDGEDGIKGDKGDPGEQGPPGEKGDTGQDGAPGQNGANGQDGYTPVRGTDYWTEADKSEIVQDVLNATTQEEWAFELEDGQIVTKTVMLSG